MKAKDAIVGWLEEHGGRVGEPTAQYVAAQIAKDKNVTEAAVRQAIAVLDAKGIVVRDVVGRRTRSIALAGYEAESDAPPSPRPWSARAVAGLPELPAPPAAVVSIVEETPIAAVEDVDLDALALRVLDRALRAVAAEVELARVVEQNAALVDEIAELRAEILSLRADRDGALDLDPSVGLAAVRSA